ncbi:DNA repair exonuclease SbcCD ATPase subunit [Paraburkholderia sp. GAS448]|uniref:DUF3732 domain-containing protein n=1 Tax=Paraburkholderia sp. GAS448 TaxID=3035136 RepID=UPI003D25E58D
MNAIQIVNILLWQKNGILRNLELKENHVNVITGDSGKGKSSILHIIDYCLLSSEAKGISKANIDSKVNWYGLRLKINDNAITVARPSQENISESYAFYSENGLIPEAPSFNIKIDHLKRIINTAFGIDSDLRVPYGGKYIRAGSRVSFRNFLGHCYQDQTTIASPEYLYIKPSDNRFQEGIQRTFRMALGIESAKTSLIKAKLGELEQKKAAIIKKLEAFDKKRLVFSDEISSLALEAQDMGLLEDVPASSDLALTALKGLIASVDRPAPNIAELEDIERRIFSIRAKNKKYSDFLNVKNLYTLEAKLAEDALKPIDAINANPNLIFPSGFANDLISHLQSELTSTRKKLQTKKFAPFFGEVEEMIKSNSEEINSLEARAAALKSGSINRATPRDYFRYLGRLEAKVALYASEVNSPPEIDEEELDQQITQLRGELEDDNVRVEMVKRQLDDFINEKIVRLKLKGYDDFKAYFSESEKLIHLYSRNLDMFEKMPDIGSASNYLYLHLAYFLSIHQIAKLRGTTWMPSFLVLDQPSTPYFTTSGAPTDDIKSLDAVLVEMDSFVKSMDSYGGFQVILLEHIEESHWQQLALERFHLVDRELRGDYGLILD